MRKSFAFTAVVVAALGLFAFQSLGDEKKPNAAAIGAAAPTFTLEDHNGQKVSLSDHQGKIVVLEWFNEDCPFVVRHAKAQTMNTLAAKYKDNDVVWLAINTTIGKTNETNKKAVEAFGLTYPVLMDTSHEITKAYSAKTTPHMFIIDKAGKLVYSGAIDDDPRGNKAEKVNYVDKALTQVIAGESVSTPETKPYGCTIKIQ